MSLDVDDHHGKHESTDTEKFYSNAIHYWSEIPATIEGMLGGFGCISQTDIRDSQLLLKQLFNSRLPPSKGHALDCGAGIGRITKHLLMRFFDKVDLVEQNSTFLEQAKDYVGPKLERKIGDLYSVGLQEFEPAEGKYDIIWIQWVLGHLTDADLVRFLNLCSKGLRKNGAIIVKENISSSDEIDKDDQDSSVTRPLSLFRKIFAKAGLSCYRQVKQRNFPKGLYTVFMFVLKPLNEYELPTNDISIDPKHREYKKTITSGVSASPACEPSSDLSDIIKSDENTQTPVPDSNLTSDL